MCEARVGVNLGVNKSNASDWKAAARDYTIGLKKLGQFADYIVINVSSPNTQGRHKAARSINRCLFHKSGLRALQNRRQFSALVAQVERLLFVFVLE